MTESPMTAAPDGILLIDKPAGCTSHDVVGKIRRLYGTRAVGHAGTLDPMATGVLVVLIGRATKASEYAESAEKRYTAQIRLGVTSDTEDITGNCTVSFAPIPPRDAFFRVCADFVGEGTQIPPMVSAVKQNGKKLYELARAGIEVERKPRPVTVFALTPTATERADTYLLDCRVSKGTYIRTLCADIGKRCGCGAVMSELRRTEAGGFSLSMCRTIPEIEGMAPEMRRGLLLPTETLFAALPRVTLPPFFEKLCRSGCEIYEKKLGISLPVGTQTAIFGQDGFFAVGTVREYPDGAAIKSDVLFRL